MDSLPFQSCALLDLPSLPSPSSPTLRFKSSRRLRRLELPPSMRDAPSLPQHSGVMPPPHCTRSSDSSATSSVAATSRAHTAVTTAASAPVSGPCSASAFKWRYGSGRMPVPRASSAESNATCTSGPTPGVSIVKEAMGAAGSSAEFSSFAIPGCVGMLLAAHAFLKLNRRASL